MKTWLQWLAALMPRKPPPSFGPDPQDAEKLATKFAALRGGSYRPHSGFIDERMVAKKNPEAT